MKYYFRPQQLVGLSTILAFLASTCRASFPANETTYLNFHIPTSLRHNKTWPHAASMFGRMGHGPEGSLVLPVKMYVDSRYLCNDNFDFTEVNKQLKIPSDGGAPFILLVESGICTFVKKVRNAQHLGAAAVLIADMEHEHLPDNLELSGDILHRAHPHHDTSNHTEHRDAFRMADDGSGRDISIPSMMIAKNEYAELKKVIDSKPNSTGIVVAEMSWHVPKFVNKVILDLWHSPADMHSKQFLASNFSVIARTFDLNEMHGKTHDNDSYNENMNLLQFREWPVLLDGKALGCVGNTDAPDEPCYLLCTNGGRYCHASHHLTDGKYIVKEALRRMCIDKHYKSPKFHWDYIDHFSKFCWDSDYFANEKCIEDAYKHSKIDKKVIESCFDDSGDPESDHSNALLQHALDMQLKWGVHKSPSVTINHEISPLVEFQGLTPATILSGLCDAFAYGDKPHVCYACQHCGDPVKCAQRSPMKCLSTDGVEKEDTSAHKEVNGGGKKHKKKRSFFWRHFFIGVFVLGGLAGGYVYYQKMEENGSGGLGSYTLQDAFLSDSM